LKEYISEIAIALAGTAGTIVAYVQGRKGRNAEADKTIADAAGKIIENTNSLLEMMRLSLSEERTHRTTCEEQLRQLRNEVDILKTKIRGN
jgi:hypothetical protein